MLIDSLKQAEHQGSVNHTSSTMSMWSGAACSFTASVQKTPVLLFCCSHSYEGISHQFSGAKLHHLVTAMWRNAPIWGAYPNLASHEAELPSCFSGEVPLLAAQIS